MKKPLNLSKVLIKEDYKLYDQIADKIYSTDYIPFTNLNTWVPVRWDELKKIKNFNGFDVWMDNDNDVYYSSEAYQYQNIGTLWGPKLWKGLKSFNGRNVWTDVGNVYYSAGIEQYKLNDITWEPMTWYGIKQFEGCYVWTDGINIYYSNGTEQYKLNGITWEPIIWTDIGSFYGDCVWTNGSNIYYSKKSKQYLYNNGVWEPISWYGINDIEGNSGIWSYNDNVYYSYGTLQYKLNGNNWEPVEWKGLTDFYALYIWSDGYNIYYSNDIGKQYVLNIAKGYKASVEDFKNIFREDPIIPINPSPVPTKEGSIWITT